VFNPFILCVCVCVFIACLLRNPSLLCYSPLFITLEPLAILYLLSTFNVHTIENYFHHFGKRSYITGNVIRILLLIGLKMLVNDSVLNILKKEHILCKYQQKNNHAI